MSVCGEDPVIETVGTALLMDPGGGARGIFWNNRPRDCANAISTFLAAQLTEKPGDRIGRYKLLEKSARVARLVDAPNQSWENRAHFFGAAAEAMRRILIERARCKGWQRRGGQSRNRQSRARRSIARTE
jgi:hypothetical protein